MFDTKLGNVPSSGNCPYIMAVIEQPESDRPHYATPRNRQRDEALHPVGTCC